MAAIFPVKIDIKQTWERLSGDWRLDQPHRRGEPNAVVCCLMTKAVWDCYEHISFIRSVSEWRLRA
jgi:hypothetical protein